MNNIKVCLTPSLFPIYSDRESIVVVVDILRATSAICTALDLGVKSITPVSTIEDALEYKDREEYVLAAERNGKIVRGFDLGNSPTDYFNHPLKGKKMVLTTTNGTKAINMAKQDHLLLAGSFFKYPFIIILPLKKTSPNDLPSLFTGFIFFGLKTSKKSNAG